MKTTFGPNFLCDTAGGGIENVGMSRAVSEMLVSAPSGRYIQLFPFWPKATPASFGGLMVKGGFRVWANYTPGTGVSDTVRLRSIAGAPAVLLNPWPGHNASVAVASPGGSSESVTTTWTDTPHGPALKFDTAAGDDRTYTITKKASSRAAGAQLQAAAEDGPACTEFSGNCSVCMASNDTRKDWASPCVFLSGPTEQNATCQPSKWWFGGGGKVGASKTYPHAHACASCTHPPSACPVLPAPPPPPPPPPTVCPVKQLCEAEMRTACGSVQKDAAACISCMKTHSALLTGDGCTTDGAVAFCGQ